MAGRMFWRSVVLVGALYVLVSTAAALARFPGYQVDGDAVYRQEAVAGYDDEFGELRTEDIVP